jgi:O-antigen/teichoic acid export membrane protein
LSLLKRWNNIARGLGELRSSAHVRASAVNAVSGIADYVAQPVSMLLAAPFLLRHMGLSQFGLWMLVSAAVSSGSTFTTGFGDAAVKYVSGARGENDWPEVASVVRGAITINLALGLLMGMLLSLAAPYVVHHVFKIEAGFHRLAIEALRIGSLILVVRSVESVPVSTLRAFEQYLPSVRINAVSRCAIILITVLLVAKGGGVTGIMLATFVVSSMAMLLQARALRKYVGPVRLLPSVDGNALPKIASFGSFSWLQALSALAFSQADRLIIGALLGTTGVAYYSVCTQAAQPIHGISSAGLHFLFPHLSARHARETAVELRRVVGLAFRLNLLLVIALLLPVALFARPILELWMGAEFAHAAGTTLSVLAVAFALLAVNITAHYTMLALGQIRYLTYLNLSAGIATALLMLVLVSHWGITGAAAARILYGPVTWVLYLKVRNALSDGSARPAHTAPELAVAVEDVG